MNSLSVELTGRPKPGYFSGLFGLNRPLKIAGLGDSIMGGDGEPAGQSRVGSWFTKACIYTDGKLIPLRYGYGGVSAVGHRTHANKNDYQAARPDILVYHFGVNDMPASGGSLTAGQRNAMREAILATANEALESGIQVIIFPEIVFANSKSISETSLHNDWLASLPNQNPRFIFMPGFEGLYDPNLTENSGDGTHPNQNSSQMLALKFSNWILPHLWGVKKFRALISEAGSFGRRFYRDPITTPYQSTNGGGYGAASSESLNINSGLDGNSLSIEIAGDGMHVIQWNGPSVSAYANRWYLTSMRVKASLLGTGRTLETKTYSKGSPDGGIVVFSEGQIDTGGNWGHILMLNKATANVSELQLQVFSRELILDELNSTGSFEIGEVYMHDLLEMQMGIPGLNWNMEA